MPVLVAEKARSNGPWRLRVSAALESTRRFVGERLGYCDISCEKGHQVDGNVWYAEQYLYPNHWQPGSGLRPKLVDDGESRTWLRAWARAVLVPLSILLFAFFLYISL
ncbi:uncharacterized protein TEOVI_000166900 [Trypanosoma equiperdum]|nr:hypothetical protein DPX39_100089000 [Trypanosoma brucei equiperdum]SCU70100.1 hypothetical protein, conserved [Trypanosoma equiperdum]